MRLPPDPVRCRQRTAADAARFPESFPRPSPAGTSGDISRPGPPPGASVSGPGRSASRPRHLRRMARRLAVQAAPADRTFRPPADRRFHSIQAAHSAPHRPEVPFHAGRTIPPRADRMFHPLSAGHAPHGGSLPCAGTGTKKRDGSPHSTQGQAQKNGTAAHTRPRKGNRIS